MILKCAAPGVATNFHVGIIAIPIMIAIIIYAMCARPDKMSELRQLRRLRIRKRQHEDSENEKFKRIVENEQRRSSFDIGKGRIYGKSRKFGRYSKD